MLKDYTIVFIKMEQAVVISRIIQMLALVVHKLYSRMISKKITIVYYNVPTLINYIMKQVIMVQHVLIMIHVNKQKSIENQLKITKNNVYSVVVVNIYILKIQLIDIVQLILLKKILVKI